MQRIALALGMLILGCISGCGRSAEQEATESAMDFHFAAWSVKNWDYVVAQYDVAFFQNLSPPAWRDMLVEIHRQLGDYRSRELVSVGRQEYVIPKGRENRILVAYRVKYAKGETFETLGIVDRSGKGDYRIVTHDLRSGSPGIQLPRKP